MKLRSQHSEKYNGVQSKENQCNNTKKSELNHFKLFGTKLIEKFINFQGSKKKKRKTNVKVPNAEIVAETCKIDDNSLNKMKKCFVVIARCDKILKQYSDRQTKEIVSSNKLHQLHQMQSNEQTNEPHVQIRKSTRQAKKVDRFDVNIKTEEKKSSIKNKKIQIITPVQMANIVWNELTVRGIEVRVGMLVCAKMARWWPWPAQITNIRGSKASVKFYGDLKIGTVDLFQCVPIDKCHILIFNYVRSIEINLRKEWHASCISNFDDDRNALKKYPTRRIFLQALRDLEILNNIKIPILDI